MHRLLVLVAAIACLGVVPASNQCVDQATLVANQSGNYTWKTTAPASNTTVVNWTNFQAWVNTKACTVSTATQAMNWANVLNCSSTHTASSHTTTTSGTATGSLSCDSTCLNNGGQALSASPYSVTFVANPINSSDPVTLAVTIAPGTGSTCTWSVTDAASVTQASGSTSSSTTLTNVVTTGTAGTWTLTVNESINTVGTGFNSPKACTIGGSLTSWF